MKERVRRALKNIFLLIVCVCAENAVNGWRTIKSQRQCNGIAPTTAMAEIDYFTFFIPFSSLSSLCYWAHKRINDARTDVRVERIHSVAFFFVYFFFGQQLQFSLSQSSYSPSVTTTKMNRLWLCYAFCEVGSKYEPMLCNTHVNVNEINLLHARMQLQLKSGRHRYTVMRY